MTIFPRYSSTAILRLRRSLMPECYVGQTSLFDVQSDVATAVGPSLDEWASRRVTRCHPAGARPVENGSSHLKPPDDYLNAK
jgi:hypothetical protein